MQPIDRTVISRVYGHQRGWVFTPGHFSDLGRPDAVRQALKTLTDRQIIRRLAHGLYDYPRQHPKLGTLAPSPDAIARALMGRDKVRLQPSGAYAANLLGLTLQVPAQYLFLTDGPSRKVQVGNQEIILKRTTPKNVTAAGRISGLVIQALRHLGQPHVNDAVIAQLDQKLSDDDRRVLLKDIGLAPAWIQKIIRRLAQKAGDK